MTIGVEPNGRQSGRADERRRMRRLLAITLVLASLAAADFLAGSNAEPNGAERSDAARIDRGVDIDLVTHWRAAVDRVAASIDRGPPIEALSATLAETRRLAERRALLSAKVERLRAQIETDPRFLPAGPLAAAQAAAQRRIETATTRADVRLAQLRWSDAPDHVAIEIAADGAYPALLALIGDLESGAPALSLERITIAAVHDATGRALTGVGADRLRLTARAVGWRRPPASGSAASAPGGSR